MPSYRSTSLPMAALLAAGLVLAGCGSDSSGGGQATDDSGDTATVTLDQLDAHSFTAEPGDLDGHTLVEGTTIRMSFDGKELSAHAGCNHLLGDATVVDGVLAVDRMAGTEMGCPARLMAQDDWLVEFLSSGPTATLAEDTLTLASGDTEVRLAAHPWSGSDGGTTDPDEPTSNAR